MSIFDSLPNVSFAEKDTEKVLEDLIKDFEETIGRKLYDGDPLRVLLLAFAKKITLQRSNIDYAGKQNLLKYATEGYLEHIGALVGVTRLKSSKATTTLRFTISQVLPSDTIIPKGTRSTPGNRITFETMYAAKIIPGETSIDITAICSEYGAIGNGFLPGEVNSIVDPFPFFQSVENITITQGGADTEDIERLRQRISEAPASFSVAGPDAAYKFWAKSTNTLISDVGVYSPKPGVVSIVPLLENGEMPTDSILEAVYNQCNDKYIRPLTDMVVVERPKVIHYDLKLTYYISRSKSNISSNIQNNVNISINKFILWQKEVLGRDINPSQLIKMIVQAGAKRVEVLSPIYMPIKDYEVAIENNIVVTFGGLEND